MVGFVPLTPTLPAMAPETAPDAPAPAEQPRRASANGKKPFSGLTAARPPAVAHHAPTPKRPPADAAAPCSRGVRRKVAIPSLSVIEDDCPDDAHEETVAKGREAAASSVPQALGPLHIEVAGFKFYKDYSQAAAEGDQIQLVREPSNKYDSKAIKIVHGDHQAQLGHVPRATAAFLSPLLDGEQIFLSNGFIAKIERNSSSISRIAVSITVNSGPGDEGKVDTGKQDFLKARKEDLLKALKKGQSQPATSSSVDLKPSDQLSLSAAPTPIQQRGRVSFTGSMRQKNSAVDKEQQPKEEQRTQQQMLTALLPPVTFETLFATSKNFPALKQWELVVEHGCASMHDVDKECKLWKIAKIQPLPSLQESLCNPDDNFERVTGMPEDFYGFLSDLEDWCIMELLDIHHHTAECHLLALRDNLAATLALAQKASRHRLILSAARQADNNELNDKSVLLQKAGEAVWRQSFHIFSRFEDDVPLAQSV